MKFLKQFVIILCISFLGELFHCLIPLPVPASIYGILLMLLCLHYKLFRADEVRETGIFLIEIMPVMFIPAAVGLTEAWEIIKPSFLQYVIIILLSTVIVMGVSGLITQKVICSGKGSAKEGAKS